MLRLTLARIQNEMVPLCIEKDWSPASMQSMRELGSPQKLPKINVQVTATVEVGRPFCQGTYTLEGNDPLMLTAHLVFERIDQTVNELRQYDGLARTRQACADAAACIESLMAPIFDELEALHECLLPRKMR
jgi:hypothetical protein